MVAAEEQVLLGVEHGDLAGALGRLSPELRAVVQATVLDGLTTREAGRLLGIPAGTVKTRMMRAKVELGRHSDERRGMHPQLLARFANERELIDNATAASLEAHVLPCKACREAVAEAVEPKPWHVVGCHRRPDRPAEGERPRAGARLVPPRGGRQGRGRHPRTAAVVVGRRRGGDRGGGRCLPIGGRPHPVPRPRPAGSVGRRRLLVRAGTRPRGRGGSGDADAWRGSRAPADDRSAGVASVAVLPRRLRRVARPGVAYHRMAAAGDRAQRSRPRAVDLVCAAHRDDRLRRRWGSSVILLAPASSTGAREASRPVRCSGQRDKSHLRSSLWQRWPCW